MSKIEVLQTGPYDTHDEKKLNEIFTMHRFFDVDNKEVFLERHGASIKGIATRGDLGASRSLIESLPNLEIISIYGVGYDAVNLEAARDHNVTVTNTPDVLTKDCADLAVAMMLAQSRGVIGGHHWVVNGNWSQKGMYPLMRRAHGKRVGILGLGRIGYEVARRLAGFDMEIFYSARNPRDVDANWTFVADPVELAKKSDILFVTLAASAETRHIVNQEVLEALGPEGMLINVSRAANIDENALLDALEIGTIGSAAIDVFEGEPDINPRFLKLDNVLLQPHQASGTVETRKAMGDLVLNNLLAHFDGREVITPVL
ncbi:MAG: 2-hydroxyacid dehydrogenase [Stappiaceae bacterium]